MDLMCTKNKNRKWIYLWTNFLYLALSSDSYHYLTLLHYDPLSNDDTGGDSKTVCKDSKSLLTTEAHWASPTGSVYRQPMTYDGLPL